MCIIWKHFNDIGSSSTPSETNTNVNSSNIMQSNSFSSLVAPDSSGAVPDFLDTVMKYWIYIVTGLGIVVFIFIAVPAGFVIMIVVGRFLKLSKSEKATQFVELKEFDEDLSIDDSLEIGTADEFEN